MPQNWMIRAGSGNFLVPEFEKGYVGIGFSVKKDLSEYKTKAELKSFIESLELHVKPHKIIHKVNQYWKFMRSINVGDNAITYDSQSREYLIGKISSDYFYSENTIDVVMHLRKVEWQTRISRDGLSLRSRNSLGSVMTLFSVNDEVWNEIQIVLSGKKVSALPESEEETEDEDLNLIYDDTAAKAFDLIQDKILSLEPEQMEELVAEILKAMGYKARVSPTGPDRGVDVFASKDGLGLEEPRIKAEVKHRPNTSFGSQDLRSFIAGLREGDHGLYVTTGKFTKEARYEAERAPIPVMLIDREELARLVIMHYENFHIEGRNLIPLTKIYWPVD